MCDRKDQSQNHVYDRVEDLENYISTSLPLNQFEEWLKWTLEGKLWKFPIDNDQGNTFRFF